MGGGGGENGSGSGEGEREGEGLGEVGAAAGRPPAARPATVPAVRLAAGRRLQPETPLRKQQAGQPPASPHTLQAGEGEGSVV